MNAVRIIIKEKNNNNTTTTMATATYERQVAYLTKYRTRICNI